MWEMGGQRPMLCKEDGVQPQSTCIEKLSLIKNSSFLLYPNDQALTFLSYNGITKADNLLSNFRYLDYSAFLQ